MPLVNMDAEMKLLNLVNNLQYFASYIVCSKQVGVSPSGTISSTCHLLLVAYYTNRNHIASVVLQVEV